MGPILLGRFDVAGISRDCACKRNPLAGQDACVAKPPARPASVSDAGSISMHQKTKGNGPGGANSSWSVRRGGNLPGLRLQAQSARRARRMRRETPGSPRVRAGRGIDLDASKKQKEMAPVGPFLLGRFDVAGISRDCACKRNPFAGRDACVAKPPARPASVPDAGSISMHQKTKGNGPGGANSSWSVRRGGNLPGLRLQAQSARRARRMRRETPGSPRVRAGRGIDLDASKKQKEMAPMGPFPFVWWRRRESNPRPQALYRQFYILSAVI